MSETRAERVREASRTLAELLACDERARRVLEEEELPDARGYADIMVRAWSDGGIAHLRLEKRRRLLQIAAWDLSGELPLERSGAALADLADACLDVALSGLGAPAGLAVVAMGKLGGRELNYVSDIDLVFVTNADLDPATGAAEALLSALGGHSPQGRAYTIDVGLRPEGRDGPLVRSFDGFLRYYRRWAQPWEFQALIKARAAAGDRAVGDALIAGTQELVFPVAVPPERIASIRRIKERVEKHATRGHRSRSRSGGEDVKLGPGGIRDIEFSVQLLQLVHGGSDPSVRDPTTLGALHALVEHGYVADEDGTGLATAYRWLRAVEHRLQLWQERRVRTLPVGDEARARLARVMGFADAPDSSAVERFDAAHRAVLADVRTRFDRLFYRPMIESLADAVGGTRLSREALRDRLRVLGFRDVERASRTLESLVAGSSRRARLLRVLTPAMLRFLSAAPLPDEGLIAFLRLAQSLDNRLDSLAALRDKPPGLELLARALGSGRLVGELLAHVPEELHALADAGHRADPKRREQLVHEARASLAWRDPERKLDGLRRFKRREFVEIVLADLAGRASQASVGRVLADLADACLEAALGDTGTPFAVIGMGKLGGRELNYASDIDVMFVHHGDPSEAAALAEDLLGAIADVTPEGQAFRVDLALRPEGKAGPLVRSLDAYLEYYESWAQPWEHLALIKARVAAGDAGIGESFVAGVRRHCYPQRVAPAILAEIRHVKARMERERIPRRTDPRRHLKLGPGGLSDIEFAAGMLQFAHGHDRAELRVTNTLAGIAAAAACGLVDADAARRLQDAYSFVTRLRNKLFLIVGRPVDVLPDKPETLEALGVAMGFTDQPRQELEDRFLRLTRRARRVAEAIIYG